MTEAPLGDNNLLLLTDSYKFSHWKQYPPKTGKVVSYFESRGGRWPEVVFFGLQYFLNQYLSGTRVSQAAIDEATTIVDEHIGRGIFNRHGWQHILSAHAGRLPVRIRAVPEGTVVPVSNVLMTIENTCTFDYWLPNYLETLLVQTWYPSTVATLSREMKKVFLQSLRRTGDPSLIDFKVHDFGFRGVSSVESAGLGGAAHLVNFQGTDTVRGIMLARAHYGATMPGFSIPAAEHSTITAWGRDYEVSAYENMLRQFPTGLVAVVSDSYDIMNAVTSLWGTKLKDQVLARDGVLVVRPDSGHPPTVVVDVLNALGKAFGSTVNTKGFKVLNPKVRVIQGDGVDLDMLGSILYEMDANYWSADNLAVGSGGGLLQKLHRDVQKFAFKCSAVEIDGRIHDVSKAPVGDPSKASKAGLLKLVRVAGEYKTVDARVDPSPDELETVFENGTLMGAQKFDEVRARAAAGL